MRNILNFLRRIKYTRKKNISKVFRRIYESNYWNSNESRSGTGSVLTQTAVIREELPKLIKKFSINSILDIPCGDFNWMKHIDLGVEKYIGADIVDELIAKNNKIYKTSKASFQVLDIVNDELPKVDLMLCRDVFVHFPLINIKKALRNIKKSKSKYLLATTFLERKKNEDIIIGDWRPLNLECSPFNFPKPSFIILEKTTQDENMFADKALALWKISDL